MLFIKRQLFAVSLRKGQCTQLEIHCHASSTTNSHAIRSSKYVHNIIYISLYCVADCYWINFSGSEHAIRLFSKLDETFHTKGHNVQLFQVVIAHMCWHLKIKTQRNRGTEQFMRMLRPRLKNDLMRVSTFTKKAWDTHFNTCTLSISIQDVTRLVRRRSTSRRHPNNLEKNNSNVT